ncbi:diguanylate cyclase [Photobacterium ganghwense]|uniref:diguanylate cyclase n=1 Tax=Photobacterium ganghwense TaxID=320778 RepID=UPI001C2CD0FB|nr:diguanylate cyclase [Photobacterium ganghwense]MBV1839149.1 diguanylate cyclase [Photobacterium ganghwense]
MMQNMARLLPRVTTMRTLRYSSYYLLTKLSLLMGIIIFCLTLLLSVGHYHNYIHLRMNTYHDMLNVIKNIYLLELVVKSERQLTSLSALLDKTDIENGQSAINHTWPIVHKIKMEADHYIYFYNAQTGNIDSYPEWKRPDDFDPVTRPWYALIEQPTDKPSWIGPYPEFGSDKPVISLGQTILSADGRTLGVLLVDMSLDSIHCVMERVSGGLDVAIFMRSKENNEMISVINESLLKIEHIIPNDNSVALSGLTQGALILYSLPYLPWEIGLYIPAHRFRQAFMNELVIQILPVTAITLITFLGILFLLKIFYQELRLVEKEVRRLGKAAQPHSVALPFSSWFVEKSLKALNKKHQSQYQTLRRDPLTRVLNRRAFDQDKQVLLTTNQSYALILIDIDHFKHINDSWGHQFGDTVLCRIAELIASVVGEDHTYRIGGDEFACIVSADVEHLESTLNKIQHCASHQQWRETECPITLSMGAAMGPDEPTTLFQQADAALYQSKHMGRNCWHLSADQADNQTPQ